MSGGDWKKPFYKVAELDSQNMEKIGNAIGWQGLEDEAKYNQKNPGHAIGKAAQYAATYYLGGLLGNGANASGAAADAASGAAAQTGTQLTEEATKQAIEQAIMEQSAQYGSTVPVTDLSQSAGLLDKGRYYGSMTDKMGKAMKAQQALGLLNPQQQQQQPHPMATPPRQQADQAPLATPYGPNGNSMGLLSFDELGKKRRLRAMGFQV